MYKNKNDLRPKTNNSQEGFFLYLLITYFPQIINSNDKTCLRVPSVTTEQSNTLAPSSVLLGPTHVLFMLTFVPKTAAAAVLIARSRGVADVCSTCCFVSVWWWNVVIVLL